MILKTTSLLGGVWAAVVAATPVAYGQPFAPDQYNLGSHTYARHCAACHGPRMKNPEGSFDLPTFPKNEKERFIRSVSKGKNSMPPWEGLLKPDEIEALWAYVHTGDK